MRIYLDEDVHPEVKKRLAKFGEVVRAVELGRMGTPDEVAYCLAVRDGFDLVVTCNTQGKAGFQNEALRYLGCRVEDLPVPIYPLRSGGNDWANIEQRWETHEARINQVLTDLGQKHDKRREAAVSKLADLEAAAVKTTVNDEMTKAAKPLTPKAEAQLEDAEQHRRLNQCRLTRSL